MQDVLMPLEGFHDGGPCGDDESNKQNCTDDHVFDPFENCLEDCAATVVNGIWIFGPMRSLLGVATFLLRWSCHAGLWNAVRAVSLTMITEGAVRTRWTELLELAIRQGKRRRPTQRQRDPCHGELRPSCECESEEPSQVLRKALSLGIPPRKQPADDPRSQSCQ